MNSDFEMYREDLACEIAHKCHKDISDYWIDGDMKLHIYYCDDWVEKDISVIQRSVDDFIQGDVYCNVDVEFEYDLWDYFFLKKEEDLIKDIDWDIHDAIEYAIDKACEDWRGEYER